MTEVSRPGKGYKDKGEPISTTPDRRAGTALDCVGSRNLFFWHFFRLSTSLSGAATFSWSGLLLTSLNLDSPSCWQLWSPRLDALFSPDFSDVIAVSWNRRLFSRFPLMSLSLAILIFWHLFFLRLLLSTLSSLRIPFSWHGFCTTSYYKSCTKYFPVLLRTTKLA